MELHLRHALILPAAMLLASVDGSARTSAAEEKAEALGAVGFNMSWVEASQPAFDRALSLMHHMICQQARVAFQQIVDTDPQCAMLHWGIATTRFQPLWSARPSAEDPGRACPTGGGSVAG